MAFTVVMQAFAVILMTGVDAQNYRITTTEKHNITLLPGATIKLPCYVANANKIKAMEMSLAFWKSQEAQDNLGRQVNSVTNIHSPFPTTRISAVMQQSVGGGNPGTSLELTMKDVVPEDSGTYRCSIMENSRVISAIHHTVKVYKPVKSLTLEARADVQAENATKRNTQLGATIVFRTGVNGYILCRASEVYPKPTLKMYIGNELVTGNFAPSVSGPHLNGTEQYMQTMYYISELKTDIFKAKESYDGKELRCELHPNVAGASLKTAVMNIQVHYKPVFMKCQLKQLALLGAKKAQLKCQFKTNPGVTKMQWTAKTTREVITFTATSPLQKKKEMTAAMTKGQTKVEFTALLIFDEIEGKHFQEYELQVTNAVGTAKKVITLEKGSKTTGDASIPVPHITWMVLLLLVSFHLHHH